jgi:hypothetical protein
LAIRGVPRDRRASSSAANDGDQFRRSIELEVEVHAEPIAQRRGEQPGAGGRADQREGRQRQLHGARARSFADDQVEGEVLHSRIEDLLHHAVKTVNLVYEEDAVLLQVG